MTRPADISPLARLLLGADARTDGHQALDAVATGFPSVDRWLGGGIRRGDLVVLGGDVGAGKSALALAMALRMAQAGTRALFCTAEISVERVLERALAIEGRTRVDDVRQGSRVELSRAGVGAAAVRVGDEAPRVARVPVEGVGGLAHLLEPETEVLVVDPLQGLAPAAARSQDEALADAVLQLKRLAVDRQVAVLLTAHVPLLQGARPDPRPVLDDFGVLGAVKQHADVVLAIFREEMYHPGPGVEGATELLVRKHRNGPTGYVDLYFYKAWLRFEDMLDPDR